MGPSYRTDQPWFSAAAENSRSGRMKNKDLALLELTIGQASHRPLIYIYMYIYIYIYIYIYMCIYSFRLGGYQNSLCQERRTFLTFCN